MEKGKEVSLDSVVMSVAAYTAWQDIVAHVGPGIVHLRAMGHAISEIPDERARLGEDGYLTIYVSIPGLIEVSMPIPPGEWAYKQ